MKYYRPGNRKDWTGRTDSLNDPDFYRIHQVVQPLDLNGKIPLFEEPGLKVALLGFACDEGVFRNHGRPGAAEGPSAFRRKFAGLPVPGKGRTFLFDAGTISCQTGDLEGAQSSLAEAVGLLRDLGYLTLVIGGGHETAFGHFSGLNQMSGISPAILNWDAHLDMRRAPAPSSGTPFRQAADLLLSSGDSFRYFCAGLRPDANTKGLLEEAAGLGAQWIEAVDLNRGNPESGEQLTSFLEEDGPLYLTIDMDVFEASRAPGVSAPGILGLEPDRILPWLEKIVQTGRLIGFDVTELNPSFDVDGRTAALASSLIWHLLNWII